MYFSGNTGCTRFGKKQYYSTQQQTTNKNKLQQRQPQQQQQLQLQQLQQQQSQQQHSTDTFYWTTRWRDQPILCHALVHIQCTFNSHPIGQTVTGATPCLVTLWCTFNVHLTHTLLGYGDHPLLCHALVYVQCTFNTHPIGQSVTGTTPKSPRFGVLLIPGIPTLAPRVLGLAR